LSSEYISNTPLLLINIGGGSTELVVKESGNIVERYNLDIGVGTVLQDFPFLNEKHSQHSLRDVVDSIKNKLPIIESTTPVAIYSGGELTYMKLVGYNLKPNDVFDDADHPNTITPTDFAAKNEEVYAKISINELESLMPDDPLWMHGARACSAIAQAVIERFGVQKLVPSDSNMIHGTAKQEYRSVVLSGSFRKHLPHILEIKKTLSKRGVEILSPRFEEPKNPGEEFVIFSGEEGMPPLELERYHLNMIDNCDALIVCSAGGYVGASALIEIGYAQAIGKRIIFTEKPEEFMLQTLPAEFGL
jgi:mazG nucleotide pyrophosphohydrolase